MCDVVMNIQKMVYLLSSCFCSLYYKIVVG